MRLSALRDSVVDNLSNDSATGFLLTDVGVLPGKGVVVTVFVGGDVLPPPNFGLSVGAPFGTPLEPPLNVGVLPGAAGVTFGGELPPLNVGLMLGAGEAGLMLGAGLLPPLNDGFEPPENEGLLPPLNDGLEEPPENEGRLPPPPFPAYASPGPAKHIRPNIKVTAKNLRMVFICTPLKAFRFPEALRVLALHISDDRMASV